MTRTQDDPASDGTPAASQATPPKARTSAAPPPPVVPRDATTAPLPTTIAQVAKWLAAHPGVDPQRFARAPKQKAAAKAVAIRALAHLGGDASLAVLTTYRPVMKHGHATNEGPHGETFVEPAAKELIAAWNRFDRRVFAERMFAGLRAVNLLNTTIADLSGLETARGLRELKLWVDAACDLAPLAACSDLMSLTINVHGRRTAVAPLARIADLRVLDVWNSDHLMQDAVDSLGAASNLVHLKLAVGADIGFAMVLQLRKLKHLTLTAGRDRVLDDATLAVLRALLARGVAVHLSALEPWATALPLPKRESSGYVVLGE